MGDESREQDKQVTAETMERIRDNIIHRYIHDTHIGVWQAQNDAYTYLINALIYEKKFGDFDDIRMEAIMLAGRGEWRYMHAQLIVEADNLRILNPAPKAQQFAAALRRLADIILFTE